MGDSRNRVLIVDDEIEICRNCVRILSKMDITTDSVQNGYAALQMMEAAPYDAVVTDLKMNAMGGLEVLSRIRERYPATRVIVITGYASVSSAVEVMKIGAFDYLPKPFTPVELRAVVSQALETTDPVPVPETPAADKARKISHRLVGNSGKIQRVISMVEKVAPTDSTVLIYGESGTGKELIARAVHANSLRRSKVFFAVDCGTLGGNLLESELFGYVRGAFTGADRDKDGIFKMAHGGTVFLDEISNISLEVQSKLLRFLESREFLPLGASTVEKVDLRVILATNRDLKEMVNEGAFREDFYYRIFVYPIMLPPLRERKSDIIPITRYFLEQFCRQMSKNIKGFSETAVKRLLAYDWPGNVRQLRNVVERAVILCENEHIGHEDIPLASHANHMEEPLGNVPTTNAEFKRLKKEVRQQAVSDIERLFIHNALERNDWNVTQAAREVGLQRSNFQTLMRKHGIRLKDRRQEDA